MLKYKQNRKLISLKCNTCNIQFDKSFSEYEKNLKLNRNNYCSRSCCGKSIINMKRIKEMVSNYDISQHCNNHVDEFTGFRYYFRNSKSRFKDFTLNLEDIKNQWDKQKGICPYTGFNLLLYKKNNTHPYHLRASLDRIDSSKGYTKDNVEFISLPINYLKSDQITKNEVFVLLKTISFNFH